MNSIRFNFIKRAFIIPALVSVVVMGIIAAFVNAAPFNINDSSDEAGENGVVQYKIADYNSFSDLEDGDYVGSIKCENISLESSVVFNDSITNCVTLSKTSKEPWKNGGVILLGSNVKTQFKPLHNAKIGDEFKVEFFGNENYNYELKEIYYINSEKDIKSYKKDNTLVMCLRYNDFINSGRAYLYTVYVAEREVI